MRVKRHKTSGHWTVDTGHWTLDIWTLEYRLETGILSDFCLITASLLSLMIDFILILNLGNKMVSSGVISVNLLNLLNFCL